ncbi:GSCFA domain-containing protein [Ruegeria sp.]|uniref:GSCFA domain-containing protein n=1 Tax=Ruegeria sp. TaxID=1879320 RepID=UPI003C7A5CD9
MFSFIERRYKQWTRGSSWKTNSKGFLHSRSSAARGSTTSFVERHYKQWSRGLDDKFKTEGHAPHDACTRLIRDEFIDIAFHPKFKLAEDASYFAIGSCFARNIEAALLKEGYPVLSTQLELPPEAEARIFHFQSEVMTKFNPHSMEVEIERAFSDTPIGYGLIEMNEGKLWNPQLHRVGELSVEGQLETTKAVRKTVRKISEADVVFITLGLTETWWDVETNTPLNDAPADWRFAKRTGRFEFRNTGFAESYTSVERLLNLIRANSTRDPKIILTVSPVPLLRTFTDQDIIVANSYSKSTLRAVATEIAGAYADVDYFPSFEMVTYSPRHLAWRHDQRHVEPPMVWSITRRFRESYIEG